MAYTTINKSTDHFNTKIYTGNGSQPRAITGIGHQPDFVWLKDRDTAYHHQLYDSVRGTSAGVLYSSLADGEDSSYALSSFDSDGFTLGSNLDAVNGNNKKIVSWNWKGGGTGSSNTDGSITSTVSANTTAGFSIVKWTGNGVAGASIGHGLGVIPKMIIVKRTNASGNNWTVYHASLGNTHRLELNTTTASTSDAGAWNNNTPTSTVFYTGNNLTVGNSGSTYIAYCFAEKTGYSKFSSYIGNGNANGTFVYTGFKPAWILFKRTDSSNGWYLVDVVRQPINGNGKYLIPNNTDVEQNSTAHIDCLSNGFKVRSTDGSKNGSNNTYIYMAFAEAPLVGTNNIPCTAR